MCVFGVAVVVDFFNAALFDMGSIFSIQLPSSAFALSYSGGIYKIIIIKKKISSVSSVVLQNQSHNFLWLGSLFKNNNNNNIDNDNKKLNSCAAHINI